MLKDYSEEAYAEIRKDLHVLAGKYRLDLKKLKMKPIIVKGFQCRSEEDLFGLYEADMLTLSQFDSKKDVLANRNTEYFAKKRMLEEQIEILEKIIDGCFSNEAQLKKLRGEIE